MSQREECLDGVLAGIWDWDRCSITAGSGASAERLLQEGRVMMRIAIVMVLLVSVHSYSRGANLDAVVDSWVQDPDQAIYSKELGADIGIAAAMLVDRAKLVTDNDKRAHCLGIALSLEGDRQRVSPTGWYSDNEVLIASLVSMLKVEKVDYIADEIAEFLWKYVRPELLAPHSNVIEPVALKRKRKDLLLLYGCLPSSSSEAVRTTIGELRLLKQKYESEGRIFNEVPRYEVLDAILARHGDKEAEQRFQAYVMEADRVIEIRELTDLCSYVGSVEVQKLLASNLRSEEVLLFHNGPVPRRVFYFLALARMFLDEETFPAKEPLVPVTDSDYASVESWCTEHLGTVFPDTPWKSDREIRNAYEEQKAAMKKKDSRR